MWRKKKKMMMSESTKMKKKNMKTKMKRGVKKKRTRRKKKTRMTFQNVTKMATYPIQKIMENRRQNCCKIQQSIMMKKSMSYLPN